MVEINRDQVCSLLTSREPVIILFWKDRCPSCAAMKFTLKEAQVPVFAYKVTDDIEFSKSLDITGVPSIFYISDYRVIGKTTGLVSIDEVYYILNNEE